MIKIKITIFFHLQLQFEIFLLFIYEFILISFLTRYISNINITACQQRKDYVFVTCFLCVLLFLSYIWPQQ